MQYAKAGEEIPALNIGENPAGYTCFDRYEIKGIASYKKQCDVVKLNFKDLQKSYDEIQKRNGEIFWWQTAAGVVSIGLSGVIIGLVAGSK